jgi:tRNA nucleotidyltransferase/poly(A) polymerase
VTEIEELQKIQREAAERRAQRDQERQAATEANVQQTAGEQAANPCNDTPPSGDVAAEAEQASPGLGNQLGDLWEELEEAARDHPTLALLAAFSMGVIVGQIFSRK